MNSLGESLTCAWILAIVCTQKFDPSSSTTTPFFFSHVLHRLEGVSSGLLCQNIEEQLVHPGYISRPRKSSDVAPWMSSMSTVRALQLRSKKCETSLSQGHRTKRFKYATSPTAVHVKPCSRCVNSFAVFEDRRFLVNSASSLLESLRSPRCQQTNCERHEIVDKKTRRFLLSGGSTTISSLSF